MVRKDSSNQDNQPVNGLFSRQDARDGAMLSRARGVCGWTTVLHYDVWAVTIVLSVCGLFVCVCSIDPRVFGV